MTGPSHSTRTYTDGLTKNMNIHLECRHGVTKDAPYGPSAEHSVEQSPLTIAFARGIHNLQFNSDLFKALLVQWIYANNISFRVVEQPTFRLILGYLMACVSVSPSGRICILWPCILTSASIVILIYGRSSSSAPDWRYNTELDKCPIQKGPSLCGITIQEL